MRVHRGNFIILGFFFFRWPYNNRKAADVTQNDDILEARIDFWRRRATKEQDQVLARDYFRRMASLINQRAPEHVASMEQRMGLR